MDARTVHRPELFAKIPGLTEGEVIEPEQLIKLIPSPARLFFSAMHREDSLEQIPLSHS